MTAHGRPLSRRGLIAACALGAAAPVGNGATPAAAPTAQATPGPAAAPAATADPVSLLIVSAGDAPDRLVGASSPVAERVELRRSEGFGAAQRDVPVPAGIVIPSSGAVILEPLGAHLALLGLTRPLVQGETFALLLEFERAGQVAVTGRVRRKQDAAGVEPIAPVTAGGLTISLVSARPAPGPPPATPAPPPEQ